MSVKEAQSDCCERCQIYWSCDTKWYRGERHEEDICCSRCNFYTRCVSKLSQKRKKKLGS